MSTICSFISAERFAGLPIELCDLLVRSIAPLTRRLLILNYQQQLSIDLAGHHREIRLRT